MLCWPSCCATVTVSRSLGASHCVHAFCRMQSCTPLIRLLLCLGRQAAPRLTFLCRSVHANLRLAPTAIATPAMEMSARLTCRYHREGHLRSATALLKQQCAAGVRGARRSSALVDVSCLMQLRACRRLRQELLLPLLRRRRSSAGLLTSSRMHLHTTPRNLGTSLSRFTKHASLRTQLLTRDAGATPAKAARVTWTRSYRIPAMPHVQKRCTRSSCGLPVKSLLTQRASSARTCLRCASET